MFGQQDAVTCVQFAVDTVQPFLPASMLSKKRLGDGTSRKCATKVRFPVAVNVYVALVLTAVAPSVQFTNS
jgi:hypothetical protein